MHVFNAIDTNAFWSDTSRLGLVRSVAWIPGNFLSEGTHFITVIIISFAPQYSIRHGDLPEAIAFQVVDAARVIPRADRSWGSGAAPAGPNSTGTTSFSMNDATTPPSVKTVLLVIGTRPEAIKMAPVVRALAASRTLRPVVCATAQHRELLDEVVRLFGLEIAVDLDLMKANQPLAALTAVILQSMDGVLQRIRPDALLVQGDTTTAMAATLAAFYQGLPVGHVEAGLRTHRLDSPFPEEANRQIVSRLARWHFAPTEPARRNLLAEGIAADSVFLTGNTVMDALKYALEALRGDSPFRRRGDRRGPGSTRTPCPPRPALLVLVTVTGARTSTAAWRHLPRAGPAAGRPARLRRAVPGASQSQRAETLEAFTGRNPRFQVVTPVNYAAFIQLMTLGSLIITDSGGIQEEASALGIPLLITRDTTERAEALDGGSSVLTGTDPDRIFAEAVKALARPRVPPVFKAGPFGDGTSALQITRHLENLL
ncbi:MAG: UDP-N-acetylglucosamine 2-epimerase (non-hydrolyzing) [Kiritimatiellia bacterium]